MNIECRGRNGWFKLAVAEVTVFRDGTAAISMVSKRSFSMPPIYLSGPVEEMQALLDDLRAQLQADAALLTAANSLA